MVMRMRAMKDFFARIRTSTARFMVGRNGNDPFNLFLLVTDIILLLIATIFSGKRLGRLLLILVPVLLVYAYFRMLSRSVYKRQQENGKYLRLKAQVLAKLRLRKEQWTQRRDYKFFTCPACRTVLRVPRGRGRIQIVCRRCGHSFMGKS